MSILFDLGAEIWGILRKVFLFIDSLGLTFIDEGYNLIIGAATAFNGTEVAKIAGEISQNCYIIIGIFALFRIALMLVNSMIDPDKLNDKQEGFGNMLSRLIITIVLFVAVPIIFDMSREIQAEIMDNNYISKLLIGKDLTGSGAEEGNPGTQIKDIAVRSLIKPDDRIAEFDKTSGTYKAKEECDGDQSCEGAIKAWNADVSYNTLNTFIGVYVEQDDENIYAYNYTPIITLLVGGFITYVLFSFAIDIAIRSVELVALEILSPLFIVTYIDPKQGSKGTFNRWLSACGKTYVSLFIKIAIVCLMLLFISKLHDLADVASDKTGLLQILILIAILIFAKKAPKWIGEMLGVEGGMGELGIGKKIKDGALGGSHIARGARTAAGIGLGAAALAHKNNKARRIAKKDARTQARDQLGYKRGLSKEAIAARKALKADAAAKGKTLSQMKKDAYKQAYKENKIPSFGKNLKQGAAAAILGGIDGAKVGFNGKDIKGVISGSVKSANKHAVHMGLRNDGFLDNIGDKIKGLPGQLERNFGTGAQRYDARDAIEKRQKVAGWTAGGDYGVQDVGLGQGKVIAGQKDFNNLCNTIIRSTDLKLNEESVLAAAYAVNRGYAPVDKDGKIDLSNVKLSADGKSWEFGAGITPVSNEDLKLNLGGVMATDGVGVLSQEKMLNTYQTNSLNNYTQNTEYMSQMQSQYQSASTAKNDLENTLNALLPGLVAALSSDSIKISFDGSSITSAMKNIDATLNELGNKINDPKIAKDELKKLEELREQLEDFKSKNTEKENFEEIMDSVASNIGNYNKAQEELKAAFGEVGNTLSEVSEKLSLRNKKLDDTINGINSKIESDK